MAMDLEQERQRVEEEERELVFGRFTNDDALELGLLLAEKARARNLAIAIDVERGGQRLFHFAAAGTSPDNAAWIERKKNLVRRMFRSSYGIGLKLATSGKTLADSMGVLAADYAAHGGCFPVVVRGVGFVGTVTVSGLPQKEDHDLVVEAIRELLARATSAGRDIYTEPDEIDLETLRNLGPLAALAGTWEGEGIDTHPVAAGTEDERYRERIVFEPIDPQANGPQLLYGLRYHVHVNKLDELPTFHDQVGYWLWEPATKALLQTIAIPRGQVAQAIGTAEADARRFSVRATVGSPTAGILSAPFLHENFRTPEYSITITVNDDASISYEQDTILQIPGRPEPFHHVDRNTLRRVAPPIPNPAARAR
jgi:uncharacterized protein (UPF0303 family)